MKKIFYTFVVIFILSFIFLPKSSYAIEALSITNPTQTSITLKGEGLISTMNLSVIFNLKNRYSSTPTYSKSQQVLIDGTGVAFSDFSGLSPGGQYTGTMNYYGGSTILGTVNFYTVSGITLSITNPTQTSITLKAENLSPNTNTTFNLKNKDSSTPTYSKTQQATSDALGLALSDFSGLSSGGHYTGTINYIGDSTILGTATFYTSGDPNPNPAPNPNPTKTGTPGVLVPCSDNCGFNDLLTLVNTIINFILFVLAVPIAAIMFAYAGFLLIFSGGESGKRTKAKDIFLNVVIGLAVVAAAWLIVHTILSIVGYQQSWGT